MEHEHSKKEYELNNLKRVRKHRNLTQKELAAKTGIKLGTIRAYEQGRILLDKAPALNVYRLAKALSVQMETLLQLEDDSDRKKRYYTPSFGPSIW